MNPQLRFQRHELKYYLPEQKCSELLRLISPYVQPDPYLERDEAKSYMVRSLYLDTSDLRFYHEKLDGLLVRKKFRVRGYNNERDSAFFEIKRRCNGVVIKDRAPGHYEEIDKILDLYGGYSPNGGRSDAEMEVINSFLLSVPILQLRPTVLIAYDREAYMSVFDDDVRLTLDRNLRCLPGRGIDLFYSGKDWISIKKPCIMELKFNHALPLFFKRIIKKLGLQKEAISKYCLCIEKCKGVLLQ